MVSDSTKILIKKGESGSAVEDVQRKLYQLGYLKETEIDSFYGDVTSNAVSKFASDNGLAESCDVTEKIWALLVDASYKLGDRNLFLRIPYFHGNDVLQLQKALGALGFQVRTYDGIFGTSTERALRRFQINMGLPSDGIAGSQTFASLKNLKFTWAEKLPLDNKNNPDTNIIWRASEVLENNSICIFGTDPFTRDVAIRMSNLARATNPFSKILSSNALSVAPDKNTILLHLVLPEEAEISNLQSPRVLYSENNMGYVNTEDYESVDEFDLDISQGQDFANDAFVKRLTNALSAAKLYNPPRLSIQLPGKSWWNAGENRSAQHFAITSLDALCSSLQNLEILENE